MAALTRRSFVATLLPLASAFPAQESASNPKTIDDFFREFTGDWVRADPDLATRTRFLTGAEQDRLEQRLSPWTRRANMSGSSAPSWALLSSAGLIAQN